MVALGALSAWEGWRIRSTARQPGAFDLVGPDGYFIGVAFLLIGLGIAVLTAQPGVRALPAETTRRGSWRGEHVALFGLCVLYAALLATLGYLPATVLFFVAAFRLLGSTATWKANLLLSAALGATMYLVFERFAQMPLPKGMLGLGIALGS